MGERSDEADDLAQAAEALAQSVDDFRERLIASDMPGDVITAWHDAAVGVWDAVETLGGSDA